jgi:hypothetical protein
VIATRYTEVGGILSLNVEKVAGWRKKRDIPASKRVLLIQETKDKDLESLFPATLRSEFFPTLARLRKIILVSPGHSVYDDGTMCEWLQLLNLKRSIFFTYMANLHGIPCVTCIGWNRHRRRDLERLAEWLLRQGDKVTHLAVNAQTGGPELWGALIEGMCYLEATTGRSYHWLIVGGTDTLPVVYARFPKA